jgi:hypothetical protein
MHYRPVRYGRGPLLQEVTQKPGEEQMKNWINDWNNRVAEVLENCARAWRDGTIGWTQKAMARNGSGGRTSIMYSEDGTLNPMVTEVCSAGAVVWQTKKMEDLFYAAKRALENKLGVLPVKVYPFGLLAWNDEPGRTVEEVIDLFEETAKDLRNGAEV